MSNMRWFFRVLSWVRSGLIIGFALFAIKIVANLTMTGVQKWIIDDIIINGQYDRTFLYLSIFAISLITFNLFHLVAARFFNVNFFRLFRLLTEKVLEHWHRWMTSSLQQERIGKLVNHITGDVQAIAQNIPGMLPLLLQHGISLVLLGGFIGWASPIILLMVIVVSIVYIALVRYIGPQVKRMSKKVRDRNADLQIHIEESVSASREIVAFHRLAWEEKKYKHHYGEYFRAVMEEGKLVNKQMLLSDPLRWIVTIATLGVGGILVLQNNMSIGTFVVVFQFSSQLMVAAQGLFNTSMQFAESMAAVERLRSVLDRPTWDEGERSISSPSHELSLRELSLQHVSFRYAEHLPQVLNGISVDLPIGKKIAFVGESGSGKSTIAQLLIRFFPPTSGELRVNGIPLREVSRQEWTDKVSIVFQEPYFFPETIRHNLLFGRDGFSDEDLMLACQVAQIDSLITELPNGLDTELGERGISLSGGQRQRLAIARALLGHPEVLILDEATSALDLETERMLQRAVDAHRQGLTTIVIAHRLSTIQNADCIYVMQKGSVVEQGTHDEIVRENGGYSQLFHREGHVAKAIPS